MSLFVIVIASFEQPVYLEMIKYRKLQLNQYKVPYLFVYDTEPPFGFVCDEHDIILKKSCVPYYIDVIHPELNPHMILKFLKAVHFITISYDYLVRVNLSTFVNFPSLLNMLSYSPKTKFAAGFNICISLPDWCLAKNPKDEIDFISGTFMLFSKDVIDYFKSIPCDSEPHPLVYTHNDDVILSYFAKEYGVRIQHIPMFVTNINEQIDLSYLIYRIRHKTEREVNDIGVWKKLLRAFDTIDVDIN